MLSQVSPTVDVAEEAAAVLKSSPYREVRNVVVDVDESGRLRLRGVVSTFYLKQLAQELIRAPAVSQGLRIHNRIEVSAPDVGSCVDSFCPSW